MAVTLPTKPDTLIEVNVEHVPEFGDLNLTGLWLKGQEVAYRPGHFWVQFGSGWWCSAERLAEEILGYDVKSVPVEQAVREDDLRAKLLRAETILASLRGMVQVVNSTTRIRTGGVPWVMTSLVTENLDVAPGSIAYAALEES